MEMETENSDELSTATSYGDLVTAILFVFIITLVAYVINFTANQAQSQQIGQKVSDLIAKQSFIVGQIERRLLHYGVEHTADKSQGVIRISSDDLAFEPGSYELRPNHSHKVDAIARALARELPCYGTPSAQVASNLGCTAGQRGQLRAVAVEGHTDNVPLGAGKGLRDNMDLSLMRAATIVGRLRENPTLSQLENGRDEKIFNAAGYGETRPINPHDTPVSDQQNRRIEIRVILENPWML